MNAKLIIYRLLTFILLPIAGINAIGILTILPAALGNPTLLIGVFIECAIIIYSFASFVFFLKGIQNGKTLKPSLKDLIKVNAYITIGLASLMLFVAFIYLTSPEVQKMVADNISQLKPAMDVNNTSKANQLLQLKRTLIVAGGYSVLLFVHVIITFQLIKKYSALFNSPGETS